MATESLKNLRIVRLEAIENPEKLVTCPECKNEILGKVYLLHSESHVRLPTNTKSRLRFKSNLFPKELIQCHDCKQMIMGRKYIQHSIDHEKEKQKKKGFKWGNIPIIKKQKAARKKIREALKKGRQRKISFVSGGAPGLGKKN